MMKTSRTRLSIGCSSAVASSHWMARRCERSIWGLTTPRQRDHRRWLINRPEFPEFRRQNFRNPHPAHMDADLGVVAELQSSPTDGRRRLRITPDKWSVQEDRGFARGVRHGLERYAFRLVEGSRSDVTAHAASILRTSRWSLGSECSNGIDMGR